VAEPFTTLYDRQFDEDLNRGAVYTPAALGVWVAELVKETLGRTEGGLILDPACGDGALLSAARAALPRHVLAGIDIDPAALRATASRLPDAQTVHADFLIPLRGSDPLTVWTEILGERPAAIIANPPWGADLEASPKDLRDHSYGLATGQFDSYDLFLELSLRLVREDGVVAFIIPDSLFLPEHTALRRRLLQSEIVWIARLGEGFFPDVFRGCCVVVVRNRRPSRRHAVRCVRFGRTERYQVLHGGVAPGQLAERLLHRVPQTHFSGNAGAEFDLDVRHDERVVINRIAERGNDWSALLESGRGVELTKTGDVVRCPSCEALRPLPRSGDAAVCSKCGARFRLDRARVVTIVSTAPDRRRRWEPLIVGEDVTRYAVSASRFVQIGLDGINYKDPATYAGRKLLVRKTGVGLNASIDETGAFTNQVVFHYKLSRQARLPAFYLHYVLGVMCSRVMLAFHLKKLGESEWRSHPYVTQRVLSDLPIPTIEQGTWQWTQARAIADAARKMRSSAPGSAADLRIESLVAGLYGMSAEDFTWALRVLEDAEGLRPIRSLRLPARTRLEPHLVS
jgi:adenine-specific DNA-methyltransferase